MDKSKSNVNGFSDIKFFELFLFGFISLLYFSKFFLPNVEIFIKISFGFVH